MNESTTAPMGVMIVNRADYKLSIALEQFRPEEYLLSISRWIPETAWQEHRYFLTAEELLTIQEIVNGTGKESRMGH